MTCPDRELDLNALIDAELDPDGEAGLLAHIAGCPGCAADLAGLLMVRARLARMVPAEAPPGALVRRVERTVAGTMPLRSTRRWPAALGLAVGGLAIAASIVLTTLPDPERPTLRAVADAGLRGAPVALATIPMGATDTWFATHGVTAPPARDLTAAGFDFVGCRSDIVAGHRAAILIYAAEDAPITVLAWPAHGEPAHGVRTTTNGGRAVRYWNDGATEFWVTGGDDATVARFAAAYRGRA